MCLHMRIWHGAFPRQKPHCLCATDERQGEACLMTDVQSLRNKMLNLIHASSIHVQAEQLVNETDVLLFDGRNDYDETSSINLGEILDNPASLLQSLPNTRNLSGMPFKHSPKRTVSDTPIPVSVFKDVKKQPMWFSSSPRQTSKKHIQLYGRSAYTIEYSVFKPVEYLTPIADEADFQDHYAECMKLDGSTLGEIQEPENKVDPSVFNNIVSMMTRDTQNDKELKPLKISQGSSGSYFILGKSWIEGSDDDETNYRIFKRGIFKPKDEEPYGPLSPKWTKWLHRTFFPCFFGRSCLIPNLGYISEAAACVLDQQLLSYIVPYTDVIFLKSSQFYYSFWERTKAKGGIFKIGSFQMFLNDYMEAQEFFKLHPIPQNLDILPAQTTFYVDIDDPLEVKNASFQWSKEILAQFQEQLEKLVILDYIMRNTDRGHDNWMIKLEWREGEISGRRMQVFPFLKIGAIDSGLAFPWKHPNEWRSFPFGWLFLPYSIIGQPFSTKTRKHYLPLLTSKYWWEQTVPKLKSVFMKDADFKERMWLKQVAVLKGQAFNVVEILKLHYAGPLELTRRENLLIWDDVMNVPISRGMSELNQEETSQYDSPGLRRGPSSGTDLASEYDETTPLLRPHTSDNPRQDKNLKEALAYDSLYMSGFEFNLNIKDEDRHKRHHVEDETSTRRVVMERLEKVDSKPPVFTWC